MRSVPLRLWALSLLSALLQLLPFPLAGPVPLGRRLFCWFCLVPLLLALLGKNKDDEPLSLLQSTLIGYLAGVCWFAGNCYWIYSTMHLYGGLPEAVSAGILVLFSFYLGMYSALFGACFSLIRRWNGETAAICVSPMLWVAVELARARITGFPWDLLGYTQVDSGVLTPLAPWTGVMGLSLLVAAGNALWFTAMSKNDRLRWIGPALVCSLAVGSYLGSSYPHAASQATAAAVLVQDNLSVGAEAQGPQESQVELIQSLSYQTLHPVKAPSPPQRGASNGSQGSGAATHPQLVVWPEAPTSFSSADPQFRADMGVVARADGAPLIVDGVALGDRPKANGRYNEYASAAFFLPDGTYAGRYDKMHLVPFGEYTPYKELFFFAGHLLDQLPFVPGTERRLFSVAGHRYGIFICYESIFGDEVREFAGSGAQVLVNLSDDGWYGDSSAPWEHLDMARMRAIENRRWLLRDTNTGVTGSIDPRGRLVAQLPRHIRGAIEVPFAYRDDLTFYTRYGDWIAWLCVVLVLSVLAGGYLQGRYPYSPPGAE